MMAANLLKVSKLRDFHAIAPAFPAKAPGTQRRAFPIVFHKADIMQQRIETDCRQ